MSAISKNIKQWWLPSLILMVAILLVSLLLPNLIYPSNVRPDNQLPGVISITSTPTLTPTLTNNSFTPTTSVIRLETQVTATLEVRSVQNCTYTMYYWRSNPNSWLAENILIGRFSYSKSEAIEILKSENQEVTTDLLQQFFATLLNSLKGADTSSVDNTLVQASDWLSKHALGFEVSLADRQTGAALAQTLEDYNIGVTGPGPCADEPHTPTPLPTDTPTPTETPTPTRVATRRPPTATPEPRETQDRDRPTQEPTAAPTEAPPPTEPPPPTQAQPPTQPPPTNPPATPTSPPIPTDAPTDVP
jgi:hypothetical protein